MFSSGMDTADLGALAADPAHLRDYREAILAIWNLCEDMAKPTIAQIHGACLGGAAELALACDMRVMAAEAVIGLVETRIGLIPDVGGCSRLPALVGLGRAKELIMASKIIDGTEAERIGLVNRVAPAGRARRRDRPARAGAARLRAARRRPRQGRARTPPPVPRSAGTLEQEVAAQELCATSDDFREGDAGARREARAAVQRALRRLLRHSGRRTRRICSLGALPEPVSIIGASGALGFGLAIRLARAGCAVTIGSRDAERAEQAAVRARELVPDSLVAGCPTRRPPRATSS